MYDVEGVGALTLEFLKKPKKYSEPFLLRDITSVYNSEAYVKMSEDAKMKSDSDAKKGMCVCTCVCVCVCDGDGVHAYIHALILSVYVSMCVQHHQRLNRSQTQQHSSHSLACYTHCTHHSVTHSVASLICGYRSPSHVMW